MLPLADALQRVLAAAPTLGNEEVPLPSSVGRICAQDLSAPIDLPPFDNSAMDGYAVRSEDVATASMEHPVKLRQSGSVAAGTVPSGTLEPGCCMRIFTGARLPEGADAVVMQEDTRPGELSSVEFLDGVKPWENVRFRGEDVRTGASVAAIGDRITTGHLALGSALGLSTILVSRRPSVGLIATGDELREPGTPITGSQIYESNRATLAQLTLQAGGVPVIFPIVHDSLAETEAALASALARCDIVVSSGGASVGEADYIKEAFQRIGGALNFWKVAIKPGKPFLFGVLGDKLFCGLPGNPVSAFVTFLLLVRPLILRCQGARQLDLPIVRARLQAPLSNSGDRAHYFRVNVGTSGEVTPCGPQASHIIGGLACANGLVEVPPTSELAAGKEVSVLRWD